MNHALLERFIRDYPFQPATAYWRAIEIAEILRSGPWPEGRGLDVGCGDGLLTRITLEEAKALDRPVVGVDPDPAETVLARQCGIYETVHTCSAAEIPEPDSTFDWAFSNSVLEHVDNFDGILAETARVLKPGGVLLFTVPSARFHECLRGPLLRPSRRAKYLRSLDRRLYHLRYLSATDCEHALRRAGFAQITAHEYMTAPEVRRWESISRVTAGVLYALTMGRKRPIEVQRSLGMRRRQRTPRSIATLLAHGCDMGVGDNSDMRGCLLVQARSAA